MASAVVVLGGIGLWGVFRIADGSLTRQGTPIRVGLVQGNIAQEDKWKAGEAPAPLARRVLQAPWPG